MTNPVPHIATARSVASAPAQAAGDSAVEIRNVSKWFGDVTALDNVSFEIRRGEFFSLLGPSGCGKTTLLRMIGGFETPNEGQILIDGVDTLGAPPYARSTNMIFQHLALFPHMNVLDNVAFGLKMKRLDDEVIKQKVHQALELVRLDGYGERKIDQLSGGQKQRVGIARAFAGNPAMVIADEPISALDVSVAAAVTELLMDIQREHKTTLLFISHDLSAVRYLADRVVVMYLGKIMERGTTDAVFAPPYHPYTEALLSAVPIADPEIEKRHIVLEGNLPSALNPPVGCPFSTRCPSRIGDICDTEPPPDQIDQDRHVISCHIPLEELRAVTPVITVPTEVEKERTKLTKEARAKKMAAEAAEAESVAAAATARATAAAADAALAKAEAVKP